MKKKGKVHTIKTWGKTSGLIIKPAGFKGGGNNKNSYLVTSVTTVLIYIMHEDDKIPEQEVLGPKKLIVS